MKAKKVDTSHFTDAQYMTAQQKRSALADRVRFFAGGMAFKRLTKRLVTAPGGARRGPVRD